MRECAMLGAVFLGSSGVKTRNLPVAGLVSLARRARDRQRMKGSKGARKVGSGDLARRGSRRIAGGIENDD
jgi:hypothetical protein